VADEQRLFLALWPDAEVRAGLERVRDEATRGKGRPTHSGDLHATLVFLGALTAERRACVERAADAVRGPAFGLTLDRLGYWPRPRILWCGPSLVPDALRGLVAALQQGLAGCGIEPDRRPYSAHVTLARKARPLAPRPLETPLPWQVSDFALVASRLGGDPPHYEVLRRWALG
jgi:2'-5' RNA ligase